MARIVASVRSIQRNAERQTAAVELITELDRRAQDIGELTQTVGRISDQTNLLALNAAIEAARAGDHGRGFAVVADEVRALAETSDKNAQEVRELAGSIKDGVQRIVTTLRNAAEIARKETKAAASVVESLQLRRDDVAKIAEGSREILIAAAEAERAATEAAAGAEQIASAAEEQSSGAGQAQVAVQQQAKSLEQAQMAAQTLAALAERFRRGNSGAGSAEEIELGRGGALGHGSGAVGHGQRDHGGGRADRSRLQTPGIRHAGDVDGARPNRKERQGRRGEHPRRGRARASDRGRAFDRAQLRGEPHRRRTTPASGIRRRARRQPPNSAASAEKSKKSSTRSH